MADPNKICILTYLGSDEKRLADLVGERFKDQFAADETAEFMNHNIGYGNYTLEDYQAVITNPYYVMRYYHHSAAVVPEATFIADAIAEDMRVIRLMRPDIVNHAIDFFAMEYRHSPILPPGITGYVDTQAERDALQAELVDMYINDDDLIRFKAMRDNSDAIFDTIQAGGAVNVLVNYSQLPWDSESQMLQTLYPGDTTPVNIDNVRRSLVTSATRTIVDTNNDLTNRINQLFV